ncbi:efflux RND transporter periplasmic adaptor subunit [Siccirubricoccus deserti]|uniref:HlyD family efflux transporter periplasmic adaptor subunit n=1 Tax=Siccirubricoccus deserti TaxID=2013562 RepID=A0A9X0R400_9PROT|nr:HlyD family efflux transporter periplasmic adaptor subunit [Siccirubricoccus deserti]MBC4019024.1 HlyD family efflux transporter periplasmic adaptor subunit [Siccirubricoccus deserti]
MYQLVGVFRDGILTLYLDRQADNAPVTNATIALEIDGQAVAVEARPNGTYRATPEGMPSGGEIEIFITIGGPEPDLLVGSLALETASGEASAGQGVISGIAAFLHRPLEMKVALLGMAVTGLTTLLLGWAWGRDRRGAVWVAILLAGLVAGPDPAQAAPGHDHGPAAPAAPANRSDAPRRLPDGSVFLAKSTQRLLEIRTVAAQEEAAGRAISLIGRVVSDPNRGGLVQSTVGGRVVPPNGGLPRLGQTVRRGDVLALIEPPLPAADRTTIAERLGEIDQSIASAETRLQRARTLAASGAGIRTQVVDIEVELEGLRRRRAMLTQNRGATEILRAPADGVIASGGIQAGQVVEARDLLFQIIDPAGLWVEASAFGPEASTLRFGAVSAALGGGPPMTLRFMGSGRTLQQQATPVHFAIETPPPGLSLGQPVTVLAQIGDPVPGIVLDRAAVVRGGNGETIVWRQVGPERFEATPVRIESLAADRVLIAAGLEAGARIVVRGAGFINQIR